mmetsp:Transcript_48604/g.90550  ORF Transcript_48604/g.90550 Transcript_48604/m.90550 type:complete len:650 (+) Transcript_48604:316-2265(+)|eukprot:CAMPEP_0114310242 /NCGR_PEP_ID=MMETSP0059-20121206/19132_1 /TAXON_ID=36894 /ORGANISM="Pyramimonas parkeae, Strain CCMP726" /LENGTH=649 /DNA_ID=CAMNT_0001434227 /DNA_START=282 /DNA_END=2231 /DNA_ORIENTATION=-
MRLCDSCNLNPIVLYCKNDAARLCLECDKSMHSSSFLVKRHTRVWLCEVCETASAVLRCFDDSVNICAQCDELIHANGVEHERAPLLPFGQPLPQPSKSATGNASNGPTCSNPPPPPPSSSVLASIPTVTPASFLNARAGLALAEHFQDDLAQQSYCRVQDRQYAQQTHQDRSQPGLEGSWNVGGDGALESNRRQGFALSVLPGDGDMQHPQASSMGQSQQSISMSTLQVQPGGNEQYTGMGMLLPNDLNLSFTVHLPEGNVGSFQNNSFNQNMNMRDAAYGRDLREQDASPHQYHSRAHDFHGNFPTEVRPVFESQQGISDSFVGISSADIHNNSSSNTFSLPFHDDAAIPVIEIQQTGPQHVHQQTTSNKVHHWNDGSLSFQMVIPQQHEQQSWQYQTNNHNTAFGVGVTTTSTENNTLNVIDIAVPDRTAGGKGDIAAMPIASSSDSGLQGSNPTYTIDNRKAPMFANLDEMHAYRENQTIGSLDNQGQDQEGHRSSGSSAMRSSAAWDGEPLSQLKDEDFQLIRNIFDVSSLDYLASIGNEQQTAGGASSGADKDKGPVGRSHSQLPSRSHLKLKKRKPNHKFEETLKFLCKSVKSSHAESSATGSVNLSNPNHNLAGSLDVDFDPDLLLGLFGVPNERSSDKNE